MVEMVRLTLSLWKAQNLQSGTRTTWEGWGESCVMDKLQESDSPMTCLKVTTALGFYLEKEESSWENDGDKEEFLADFFPDGIPQMSVTIADKNHYFIWANGKIHRKDFAYIPGKEAEATEEGRIALEKLLNEN